MWQEIRLVKIGKVRLGTGNSGFHIKILVDFIWYEIKTLSEVLCKCNMIRVALGK